MDCTTAHVSPKSPVGQSSGIMVQSAATAQSQKLTPELIKHYLLHDVGKICPMAILDKETKELHCSATDGGKLNAIAKSLGVTLPYKLVGYPDRQWPVAFKVACLRIQKSHRT